MTIKQVIELALGVLGVLPEGDEASPESISDGLLYLNSMLGSWSTQNLIVPVVTRESFSLPSKPVVSIEVSGDLDTVCPVAIKAITIADAAGVVHSLNWISEERIRGVRSVVSSTVPKFFHFAPDDRLIFFSSVPPAGCTINIRSYKAFDQFDELTEYMSFPSGYDLAIQYNLALLMAPKFGKSSMPEALLIARCSLRDIKAKNAAVRGPGMLAMPLGMPGLTHKTLYDIYEG